MSQEEAEKLAQFEAMLAMIRAGFLAEVAERCNHIEDMILALESSQESEPIYEDLYRNVHSLKGSGGTHGLNMLTGICHQFESFITEHHGRYGGEFVSTSLAYIDLLHEAGTLYANPNPDFSQIELRLTELRQTMLKSRRPILIAEASALMCALYQQALGKQPLQVTLCNDGMSALDQLLRQPFDILIIARELKVLNGSSVVAALRESSSPNRDIPVLMVSSNATPVSAHLHVQTLLPRDAKLAERLATQVAPLLAGK